MSKSRGFTLIELMIVVVVIAILASIAVPSYRDYIMRSRRAEGMGELLELADRLERYFSDQGTYATASLGPNPTDIHGLNTEKGHYALAIPVQTAIVFTVTATPQGTQANDNRCTSFTLTSDGTKTATGSLGNDCWK